MALTVQENVRDELSRDFAGELIAPGDAGYEEARRVWNGAIDKRPSLIARCTGTADVIAAVKCARANGQDVAIRGGGHSNAGHGDDRRRDGHRLLPDEGNPRRSRLADSDGATRRRSGASSTARPRRSGSRCTGGEVVGHRHRRPDARRRHRLAEADVRTDLRQPAVRRPRHRRGRAGSRQRERERRALLGRPRRRRQLRRRDPVRVSPAPGRAAAGGLHSLSARPRGRRAALHARLLATRRRTRSR